MHHKCSYKFKIVGFYLCTVSDHLQNSESDDLAISKIIKWCLHKYYFIQFYEWICECIVIYAWNTNSHTMTPLTHTYFLSTTKCSNTCGKGTRRRHVECTDSLNDITVVDQFCDKVKKPKMTKQCEKYSCKYTWMEGYWSSVSFFICLFVEGVWVMILVKWFFHSLCV